MTWSLRIKDKETGELDGGFYSSSTLCGYINTKFIMETPIEEWMLESVNKRGSLGFLKMELTEKYNGHKYSVSIWNAHKLQFERI